MREDNRLIWAPKAQADLRTIWRYYARVASVEVADALLRDIHRATERLRENPTLWRLRDEVRPGLRAVLVHPYTVFYRVADQTIEIVRVLHERRNFEAAFNERQK